MFGAGLAAEGGIEGVEIAGIKIVLHHAEGFAGAYKMEMFALKCAIRF